MNQLPKIVTLRDRIRMARYVTAEMEWDHPALDVSDWRAIMSAEEDKRTEYIEWIYDYAEEHLGAFPTVEQIRDKIYLDKTGLPAWARRWQRLRNAAKKLAEDEHVPASLRAVLRALVYYEKAPSDGG